MYNSRHVNSSAKRGPISFSSTLLDEIYRSIDDGSERSPREKERFRAEKWIEKKKSGGGLSPPRAVDTKKLYCPVDKDNSDALFFSSGSNSSDSNSSLFSDHDVSISLPTSKTGSSCFLPPKPKPIRTKATLAKTEQDDKNDIVPKSTSTTKSRALKMYAHLKKMKQPISPGMKLTTFINSILHNTKSKRGPTSPTLDDRSKKPTTKCSSATSFTRSKNLYLNQQTTPSCKSVKTEAERPRTLTLKRDDDTMRYSSKVQIRKPVDDDGEGSSSSDSSDCSEDLFEIDHLKLRLSTDGGELPVYETTASKTSNTSRLRLSSTTYQSRTFIKGKR